MYTTKSLGNKSDVKPTDIPDGPTDTISSIAFNQENTHFAVSSWDGSVRLYRLPYYSSPAATCSLEKNYTVGSPVLCCCFFNNMLLAGLVNGHLVAVDSNNTIKAHESSIKAMCNYNNQLVVTASFDCTIKFWDLKSTSPVHTISLSAKVYAMDYREQFLIVALSDRSVVVYDMNNINHPTVFPTKFMYALRSVGTHKDRDTFVVGGIDARAEIFSRTSPGKTSTFRCHRVDNKLFSVNVVRLYPLDPRVLVSGGADGALIWFDKENRSKINTNEFGAPVTAGEFSSDGKYFVFGIGDDWSKGYTGVGTKTELKMIVVSTIRGMK